MAKKKFKAKLERPPGVGTWTYLTVPFDVPTEFGVKGQVKVKGTIDGVAFQGSLMPDGDGRHYLVVNKAVRDQAGVSPGSVVQVALERDTKARTVAVPRDFQRALAQNAEARAMFDKFAYSHQKAYIDWIQSAKHEETRVRRIDAAVKRIAAGERLKG